MKENVTKMQATQSLLDKACEEVAKENEEKAIKLLKEKLREFNKASLVVDNLKEEIKILEEKIKRGDLEE